MNDQKIKEALKEHISALKKRDERIALLETRLKTQALEGELRAKNVLSPSIVARKLAESVKVDEKGAFQISDENKLTRRTFQFIVDDEGKRKMQSRDMGIGELVDEFLSSEENQHFRGDSQAASNAVGISETEYQEKLEAAQREGRATPEFLRAWSERYRNLKGKAG